MAGFKEQVVRVRLQNDSMANLCMWYHGSLGQIVSTVSTILFLGGGIKIPEIVFMHYVGFPSLLYNSVLQMQAVGVVTTHIAVCNPCTSQAQYCRQTLTVECDRATIWCNFNGHLIIICAYFCSRCSSVTRTATVRSVTGSTGRWGPQECALSLLNGICR